MTLAIYIDPTSRDDAEPRIVLELRCDTDHGLFGPPTARFVGTWYPEQHSRAVNAGWLFTRERKILGPCCSGKKP